MVLKGQMALPCHSEIQILLGELAAAVPAELAAAVPAELAAAVPAAQSGIQTCLPEQIHAVHAVLSGLSLPAEVEAPPKVSLAVSCRTSWTAPQLVAQQWGQSDMQLTPAPCLVALGVCLQPGPLRKMLLCLLPQVHWPYAPVIQPLSLQGKTSWKFWTWLGMTAWKLREKHMVKLPGKFCGSLTGLTLGGRRACCQGQ